MVYCLLLAATLTFFAGCEKLNREADECMAEMIASNYDHERRAA